MPGVPVNEYEIVAIGWIYLFRVTCTNIYWISQPSSVPIYRKISFLIINSATFLWWILCVWNGFSHCIHVDIKDVNSLIGTVRHCLTGKGRERKKYTRFKRADCSVPAIIFRRIMWKMNEWTFHINRTVLLLSQSFHFASANVLYNFNDLSWLPGTSESVKIILFLWWRNFYFMVRVMGWLIRKNKLVVFTFCQYVIRDS